MKKNAIILAAGKSNRFAPFTYEQPKGLFCVRGEILIERQIQQLLAGGIEKIYIVVGYMKEKFFYLEQKYKEVQLVINNEFGHKGNLYSLYVARKYLGNTFICCADHYFVSNPYQDENKQNLSYRACMYEKGKFREFAVKCSDADIITSFQVGGCDSLAMVGHAYMNEKFSHRFKKLMEEEIDDFGISNMFWEEFYAKHQTELTFYMKLYPDGAICEFDDIDDLREFDADFLLNVDSDIIKNICDTLQCKPNQIKEISVINAGLTNVSFAFSVNDTKYVYRHPGGTAGSLINRNSELFAQRVARNIGVDTSVIKMDSDGWKISYYVPEAKNCDFVHSSDQLSVAMQYLHKLHQVSTNETVKVFDNVKEGYKLMQIASATKGNLLKEFHEINTKVKRLYTLLKRDAERLHYDLVLCHNDVYEPNYLIDKFGQIYLIDWEYAGLNYEANDIGCLLCRYDWSDQQIKLYLEAYFGRSLNSDEERFYYAFIAISAYYWFCWGLYKGSVGDDDGFFFLPAYHNLIRFLDPALDSYLR